MKMKILLSILFSLLYINNCVAQKNNLIPSNIMKIIEIDFPGARIAEKKDFGAYFKELSDQAYIESLYNTVIIYDVTGDTIKDYVLILINTTKRYFSFVAFVSDDNFSKSHTLCSEDWPINHDGTIWQIMWLKKPGEDGMSKEKYFDAPGKEYPWLKDYTENDINEYEIAVERYVSIAAIEKTNAKYGRFADDELFYCKSSYYFEGSEFKSVSKCD